MTPEGPYRPDQRESVWDEHPGLISHVHTAFRDIGVDPSADQSYYMGLAEQFVPEAVAVVELNTDSRDIGEIARHVVKLHQRHLEGK